MLAWWAIVSGLTSARPRAEEIPKFLQFPAQPQPGRWPCFLASLALHVAALLLWPALSDLLSAARPVVFMRRYRLLAPVEIRPPERLYLASTGRLPVRRMRTAAGQARRELRRAGRGEEPASAAAGRRRWRRFELPRLRVRKTDQTLLQPDFPPDLPVLSEITLPQVFFWAPLPINPALRIRKPFVSPGSAEPFAQAPRLEAPPQLTAPNWEALARELQVAAALEGRPDSLLLPSISFPIRLPDVQAPPARTHVSMDRSVGDPLSVLALNPRLRPLREQLLVPAGNQLAEAFGERGEGGAPGSADASDSPAGAPGSARAASSSSSDAHGSTPGDGGPAGASQSAAAAQRGGDPKSRTVSEARAGTQDAHTAATTAPSALVAASTRAGGNANGGSMPARAPQDSAAAAAGALRIEHPPGGVFDVVVVQPAPLEGFPESSGALSGRPVYSVFLRVGAAKEWILQYCVPGEDQTMVVSGGVVRLSSPAPVAAPYPRVTYLPPIQRRAGGYMIVHGYLDAEGRFRQLEVLRAADREEASTVLPILERWEFRPATRNGQPLSVEILLAIPRA